MARDIPAASIRALEAALRERIVGDVRFDTASRALYATDASNYRQVPVGVVLPRTTDDVVETIRLCRDHQIPVLPRGGGTSLAGQCCNVAVVIDTSRYLRTILQIDPDGKRARVQPGLVLDDLQQAARSHGLMYGPDPATHAWCTIGGMIGNDSCGVHSVVAGLTSDNVEELEILTPDGLRLRVGSTSEERADDIIREGGRRGDIYAALRRLRDRYATEIRARFPPIPRRVSGYNLPALLPEHGFDLARALVGSEGTCVTVLEATIRLIDAPRARTLLVLGYDDVYAAADHVTEILQSRPIGLEGFDQTLINDMKKKRLHPREVALLPEGRAWLLVEFGGGTPVEAESAARDLEARLPAQRRTRSARLFVDPHEMRMMWTIRESGLGATAFVPGEEPTWEGWEDAAVPPERLGAYLRDFHRLMDRYEYRGPLYGHFGQGCVHTRLNFNLETAAGIGRFRAFLDEAADLVVAYGGSLSGEHGDGQSRAELLPRMFGDSLVAAFREFKTIWDPDGLMNPGKVVDPFAITDNLRRPGFKPPPARTFFHFNVEGGIAGAALRCVGVGKCRKTTEGTMCPSYMVTGDEQHSTRGRARLLFEMLRGETITSGWQSEEVKHALDLCLACKGCKAECPVSVDMATYKAEFLAHYYERRPRPLRAHLFGHIDRWAAIGSLFPQMINAFTGLRPVMRPLQPAVGIAPQRRLPRLARQPFQHWVRDRPTPSAGKPVVLWSDTFTNYFHPEIGRAAVEVLEAVGYQVTVPPQTCCGRPLYDFGFLDAAKDHLERVFTTLRGALRDRVPIVILEPSCFSVFCDEATNLFPDRPEARALRECTMVFGDFIRPHFERGDLPPLSGQALVHVHCHQKALADSKTIAAALAATKLQARILDGGCCGMAGAFGFDKEHYDVSLRIGERVLLPAVRDASDETIIIADGFSCREQIAQTTTRRAHHFAEIIAQSRIPHR